MERAAVSAATGALYPVLEKLTAFMGDKATLPEGGESEIELIKSNLEPVLSALPMIWGSQDLDAPCKDWMMEVRELSYDMEEAIYDCVHQKIRQFPLEELKIRVKHVSERSNDMRKTAEVISSSSKPVIVDPRSRFLHRDVSELVGVEGLKDDIVELVVSGSDTCGDTPRRRPASTGMGFEKKIVFKVPMSSDKSRHKAMQIVAGVPGVTSIAMIGIERDMVEVVGSGVDVVMIVSALRRKVGIVNVVKVGPVEKNLPAVAGYQRSDQFKMVCIQGLPGVGKTALADLVYRTTERQFDCRAFVSVSPSRNITETLRALLREVTNSQSAYTEAVTQQYLIHEISKFLEDKRYLVIIDDIWHWEEWEIIAMSLPKNIPSSRIVITTRISAIAEKLRTDAVLYEIGGLGTADSRTLMNSALHGITGNIDNYPWNYIVEMCEGIPLAIICLSSAMKEQIQRRMGDLEKTRALRRVRDGILTIPSLKPLAESLCLGYSDLPLYLRTFLLYCSIYNLHYEFEKDRLVRRWMAERFVYDKDAADSHFEHLVDRSWIKPAASGKHEIHPVMLAFLKCKSQEDNFVTHLDFNSDILSSRKIRRLSLHVKQGHPVKFSGLDLSHTHSLTVFGSVTAVPFKQFERLRVLELEDTGDLGNAHLLDICGLLWLRHLGLMGTPITEVPPQIRRLLHLETLDIRDTGIMELPWEACKLPKSVRVLAGNKDACQSIELPEGVYDDLEDKIPVSSLEKCRDVLSIQLYDPCGLDAVPQVAVFKVPGLPIHIPELIKKYFEILFSLDIRLCELEKNDLKFLQEMPNLKNLVLRFEVIPVEPVIIEAAGFVVLESFCIDSRVPRVIFGPGAMPKLKCLVFKFYAGPESNNPVGIKYLPMLEVIMFRCSSWYRSDSRGISSTVAIVRGEAREHPNQITLYINNKKEIFLGNQSAQVSEQAGSSGTGVVEAQADTPSVSASRNSIAGTDAIASCIQTSEIEEVEDQWYSGGRY